MIILEMNVLSALMRQTPDTDVVAGLDRQPRTTVWATSVERFWKFDLGFRFCPPGIDDLCQWRRSTQSSTQLESGSRPLTTAAAQIAGHLMAFRQKKGQPVELRDTMIAGIVLARHATLATRNNGHFADISAAVVNSWAA